MVFCFYLLSLSLSLTLLYIGLLWKIMFTPSLLLSHFLLSSYVSHSVLSLSLSLSLSHIYPINLIKWPKFWHLLSKSPQPLQAQKLYLFTPLEPKIREKAQAISILFDSDLEVTLTLTLPLAKGIAIGSP